MQFPTRSTRVRLYVYMETIVTGLTNKVLQRFVSNFDYSSTIVFLVESNYDFSSIMRNA